MSIDIATGMNYLHNKGISHGNLNTNTCYIDARWNVKIGSWEYVMLAEYQGNSSIHKLPAKGDVESGDQDLTARKQLWQV